MKTKNHFNVKDFESLIPYIVMGLIGVATYYTIIKCVILIKG